MSKKTLALILSLLTVTVVLLIVALSPSGLNKKNKNDLPTNVTPTPDMAFTTLEFSPDPVTIGASGSGEVDVMMNTNANKVSGVQLELNYDPKALTNVSIQRGPLFKNGISFITNPVNPQTGHIKYLLGVSYGTNAKMLQGSGVVAQIFFTKLATAPAGTTAITFLDATKVTQLGVSTSVLKTAKSVTINLTTAVHTTGSSSALPLQTTTGSQSGR